MEQKCVFLTNILSDKDYNSCGYMNGNCSERATCTETSDGVKCQCHQGYVGDGYSCKSQCELQDNGGCHPQAVCSFNVSFSQTLLFMLFVMTNFL